MSLEELARLIRCSLRQSRKVAIEGLGVFERGDTGEVSFSKSSKPRIFIAYAKEDFAAADRLYRALTAHGCAPWLDRHKLLPGEDWPLEIEDAICSADYFIACFSKFSVRKRGGFQAEIRLALDCARRLPLDEVFLIPIRLDACRIPSRIQRETQYVDLFPDWAEGLDRIVRIIEQQSSPIVEQERSLNERDR